LKGYTDLQNIGKSLYRYNTLQEHNYINDAQAGKEDLENVVLKGGISYCKYVWHAENSEHTCDKCKELDGQVFDFYDEVPERPHPNCKCTVEVVENLDNKTEDNDNTNKIPPQNPNPQPEQKSLPPDSNPQNPPQTKTQNWIKPCNGPITSPYGYRIHPVYGTKKLHDGIDIGVPLNTPVHSAANGNVKVAKWYNGYGNYIEIDHGNGVTSFYGHLTSFNVKVGDKVIQGQLIAKSGNTGIGTGAHLHFGAHKNGQPINPLSFIRNY